MEEERLEFYASLGEEHRVALEDMRWRPRGADTCAETSEGARKKSGHGVFIGRESLRDAHTQAGHSVMHLGAQ